MADTEDEFDARVCVAVDAIYDQLEALDDEFKRQHNARVRLRYNKLLRELAADTQQAIDRIIAKTYQMNK